MKKTAWISKFLGQDFTVWDLCVPFVWISIIIIIITSSIYWVSNYHPFFFEPSGMNLENHQSSDSLPVELNAAFAIGLTFILVLCAWIQLQGLRRLERSKFLLQIAEQYSSQQIIKARQIIHKLYRNSKKNHPEYIELDHRKAMAKEIVILSNGDAGENIEDYVYLLSMLDFLESVAYMANKDGSKSKDLEEMLGNSISFYFEIFKSKIEDRRTKYKNNTYYSEFEKLNDKIKREQLIANQSLAK